MTTNEVVTILALIEKIKHDFEKQMDDLIEKVKEDYSGVNNT